MKFAYDTSYADSRRLLRWGGERLAYGALALLLAAAPFALPVFYVGELTFMFIFALASLGLMVLTGYTGQVSLGHAAFLAIGAYAEGALLARGLPFPLTLMAATLFAGVAGVVIGMPAIRVSGLTLAMVTLAFSVLVEHAAGHWTSVTGGFTGLAVGDPALFGASLGGPTAFYFLCLALTAAVLLGLVFLMRAQTGRAFGGVRALDGVGFKVEAREVFTLIGPNGAGKTSVLNVVTRVFDAAAGVVRLDGRDINAPWGASAIVRQVSGNSPLLLTTVQNYDTTTATGVSWAIRNWNVKKVGFIFQEGPFGDLVRRGLKTALDAHNLQVAAEAGYKPGDIDFSSQVARMKAAGVDLIVAATVVRETVAVSGEVKKLDWNDVKVLTVIPGRSTIVAALGKNAVEGLYGIGGWKLNYADSAPADAKKVMDAYRKKFNVDPDENALNAFSYTDWFVKGL